MPIYKLLRTPIKCLQQFDCKCKQIPANFIDNGKLKITGYCFKFNWKSKIRSQNFEHTMWPTFSKIPTALQCFRDHLALEQVLCDRGCQPVWLSHLPTLKLAF